MNKIIKVMLVDDITSIRNYLHLLLKDVPCIEVIAEAENGKIAIELLHEYKILPDIIIMDVNMPVMNGIDSTQYITSVFQSIKVIAFTSSNDDDTIRNILNAGASAHLVKGCSFKDIISTILTVAQE